MSMAVPQCAVTTETEPVVATPAAAAGGGGGGVGVVVDDPPPHAVSSIEARTAISRGGRELMA
jgi:hypothetical protein